MHAMIMRALGEPTGLSWTELPDLEPGPKQLCIDVEAIGCNFSDVLICRGAYQIKPPLPFVPGAEVAGRVRALGADVQGFAVGQKVVAHVGVGGYASQALADVARVQAVPDAMAPADAVALGIAYQTAYLALVDRARVAAGESVLVTAAAGGVGIATLQLARILGARVIAGVGDDKKAELCRAHGAHEVLVTRGEGWHERVRELTGGRGADVICESVGGAALDESLRCIAWNGRLIVVGFSSGDIPSVKLNRVMLKHVAVVGLNLNGYQEHEPATLRAANARLFELYAEGALRPLIHSLRPLREAAQALSELAARGTAGKLVLTP
jgi:NADPH2:quinone reductase